MKTEIPGSNDKYILSFRLGLLSNNFVDRKINIIKHRKRRYGSMKINLKSGS